MANVIQTILLYMLPFGIGAYLVIYKVKTGRWLVRGEFFQKSFEIVSIFTGLSLLIACYSYPSLAPEFFQESKLEIVIVALGLIYMSFLDLVESFNHTHRTNNSE